MNKNGLHSCESATHAKLIPGRRPVFERKAVRQTDQAVVADIRKIAEGIEDHDAERQQIIESEEAQQHVDDQFGPVSTPSARGTKRIIGGSVSHGRPPDAGDNWSRWCKAPAPGRAREGS